ncbi:MAG: lysophospholipid acyltransferase family protein [Bacteroidales bacterium]
MKILYYLFICLAWLVSRLPFFIIYGISDMVSLLLYHVVKYRKKVVLTNLRNAFPEKPESELYKIAHQYYRHLADIILEVIKIQGMTANGIRNRFEFKNLEILQQYKDRKKSIIIATGHVGNWEWFGPFMSTFNEFNAFAVVKPLSDKNFERYVIKRRLQFSNKNRLIDFRVAFREMISMRNEFCMTLIIGDQTPTKNEINYWTTFLHQDTAVFLGIEKIAKALDQPVIFMDLYRTRRGHYCIELSPITDKPKETAEFEITEAHVHKLEEIIRNRPYNWVWSHRRWKHKKE